MEIVFFGGRGGVKIVAHHITFTDMHNSCPIYLLYIWREIDLILILMDACWRLFDHKKGHVVAGFFFDLFHFLLFFVTFFTACNFCKLLFTVEGSLFVTFLLLVIFIN